MRVAVPVARDRDPHPARSRPGLHHPGPARGVQARMGRRPRPPRRVGDPLRPPLQPGARVPRRRLSRCPQRVHDPKRNHHGNGPSGSPCPSAGATQRRWEPGGERPGPAAPHQPRGGLVGARRRLRRPVRRGIDAFNARATAAGRQLSLAQVLRRRDQTHARLLDFIRGQPEGTFGVRTRARRRLRLDTYGHYPEHTAAIRVWRDRRP